MMQTKLATLGLSLCYLGLAAFSRSAYNSQLPIFLLIMTGAFISYGWAYASASHSKPPTAKHVLLIAVLFRVIGCFGLPLFEDDYFRYLWDGYRFAESGSPYGIAPEAFFTDPRIPKPWQAILGQINHPDIPTIYAPTFQYVFLAAHRLAEGQVWALQALLSLADVWLIHNLLKLTSAQHVLLYAWNPLVIKEIAFTAHPDGLLPALLIAAWLARQQRQFAKAGLWLALAAAAKAAAWLTVPFWLIASVKTGRGRPMAAAFALGFITLYAPFWWQGSTDTAGLKAFADGFEFNSALYGLFGLLLPPLACKLLLGGLLITAALAYGRRYWRQANPELPRADLLLSGLLLVSPVLNPWYLLWLLPFACVHYNPVAWAASAMLLLAYVTGLNLDDTGLTPYRHPAWVRPVEFGVLMLLGLRFHGKRFGKQTII